MLPGMSCLKTLMGKKRALSPFLLRVSLYTLWWLIHIRDNYSERLLLWGGGGGSRRSHSILPPMQSAAGSAHSSFSVRRLAVTH